MAEYIRKCETHISESLGAHAERVERLEGMVKRLEEENNGLRGRLGE